MRLMNPEGLRLMCPEAYSKVQPGSVVWLIEPGTKYSFKTGCCRYECPPDWPGIITSCVRAC